MKILLSLILILILSSCTITQVQPWERGVLARSDMALVDDGMEARLSQHIQFAKEASSGGMEAGGGGCGCN